MSYPRMLNVGCGPNFRVDFVNLDVDARFDPDIVHDLNMPLPKAKVQVFKTKRFGDIEVGSQSFDKIIAYNVLPKIRELDVAMTSFLNLLSENGILEIIVPHDLSMLAWIDPDHVRAFNEMSWTVYSDQFWRFGWSSHRFVMEAMRMNLTPFGQQLQQANTQVPVMMRTPRAVDSMWVQLKKVPLTEQEIQVAKRIFERKA